jgi:glutamate dehydrogenase/leucine dehydrogenase
MAVSTTENLGASQIILGEFAAAVHQLGYDPNEVLAAFAPSDRYEPYAELSVGGTTFESWRHEVGVMDPSDRSRGGLELSPTVDGEKVLAKSISMGGKHLLGGTGNVGGKGGIRATAEEIAALSPKERAELFAQHAEAHNINPETNVTATDIGTFPADMDAIAASLVREYGDKAGAAASGASKRYGGEPELHMPHTGLGASIMLDAYLKERAATDPRVAEAINGGEPLRIFVQGLGKAGWHFVSNLPKYVRLGGAMEQNGAIVSTNGPLDTEQVLGLARATRLDEQSVGRVDGARWLPPSALRDFWASGGDILAPAFDRHQVTADDISRTKAIVVESVANDGMSPDGRSAAVEAGVDELPGIAANIGGTLSSQKIWEKIMGDKDWTPEMYERNWRRNMMAVASGVLASRAALQAERETFVSLPDAANLIVVKKAVERLRATQRN